MGQPLPSLIITPQDKFAALVLGMLQRQLKERERGVEKRERNLEDKENAPPVVEKKIVEPVKEANLKVNLLFLISYLLC